MRDDRTRLDARRMLRMHRLSVAIGETTSKQRRLLALVAPHAKMVSNDSPWRVAVHEAGHALVHLVRGIDFALVRVGGNDERGERIGGALSYAGLAPSYPQASMADRLASDLGGAMAEAVVLGSIDPNGVEADIHDAFARTRVNIEEPERTPVRLEIVRGAGRCALRLLRQHREELVRLARALQEKGRLGRSTCVRLVGEVPARPLYSPSQTLAEFRRGEAVRRELAARDRRLRRLADAAGAITIEAAS
jgi:hypothetical protein